MDWMRDLPEWLHNVPVSQLAIPGSHDSGTFGLDINGPFANDQSKTLSVILNTFGCLARPIVYRWSVTQKLDFRQQLDCGIRYLDLRISSGPERGQYSVVHGLFGPEIRECLDAVREFISSHPSEIVIIDINHFYNMTACDHDQLLQIIIKHLGPHLIPFTNSIEECTLSALWKSNFRVFCVYHDASAYQYPQYVWPAAFLIQPWPNVTRTDQLVNYLENRYERGPVPPVMFYGTQGILTPRTSTIVKNWRRSLESEMALKATHSVVEWMGRHRDGNWFNIITSDFVDCGGFVEKVIALNRSKDRISPWKNPVTE